MEIIKRRIGKQSLLFGVKSTELPAYEEPKLRSLIKDLKRFFHLVQVLKIKAHIDIIGRADSTGVDKQNMEISQGRAENILAILVSEGLKADNFITKGVGSKKPLKEEVTNRDREFNRCVTFSAVIRENSN